MPTVLIGLNLKVTTFIEYYLRTLFVNSMLYNAKAVCLLDDEAT